MKIYFLSSLPCALTLNGAYYGVTDTFERSAEICLSDGVYAQFSPQGSAPVGFFITEELSTSPPQGCEVYLLKDGIAVYANDFPPLDFTLRPIAQKREGEKLATVYAQGKQQLCIQTPSDFFNATLPPSFDPCEIVFLEKLILLKGERHLAVYSEDGKQLLFEKVNEYTLTDNKLTASLPLSDSLQRTAECVWELFEKACVLRSFTVRQRETFPARGLIAYAFFESVLLNADYTQFLSDELIADKENILAFLGRFIAVTLTAEENTCALVRKKSKRLYALDYFTVEIEEEKITDIRG